MAAKRNLSAITFACLKGMSHGWNLEFQLQGGVRLVGRPIRIEEDRERKSGAVASGGKHSHLSFVLADGRGSVDVEQILDVKPTL